MPIVEGPYVQAVCGQPGVAPKHCQEFRGGDDGNGQTVYVYDASQVGFKGCFKGLLAEKPFERGCGEYEQPVQTRLDNLSNRSKRFENSKGTTASEKM